MIPMIQDVFPCFQSLMKKISFWRETKFIKLEDEKVLLYKHWLGPTNIIGIQTWNIEEETKILQMMEILVLIKG
jgi:hypothetical protein